MNKIAVTTTINPPTETTVKIAANEDWTLIVVGDLKTPHELYDRLNCIYISPKDQEKQFKELSDAIGWNCIQRRNIGFVKAYELGAEIIATIDDDNIPYDHWGQDLSVGKHCSIDLWKAENGVFDPLSTTKHNQLWHRGYPIDLIQTKNEIRSLGKENRKILVQADLWDGDPDIDAICRIAMSPMVTFDEISPFGSSETGPFNSQNTFIAREAIPHYMVLPHVGRMDDIWGAYLFQQMYPGSVMYNGPSVRQDRNVHNLVTDLENELLGYRHTMDFLEGRYTLPSKTLKALDCYYKCFV